GGGRGQPRRRDRRAQRVGRGPAPHRGQARPADRAGGQPLRRALRPAASAALVIAGRVPGSRRRGRARHRRRAARAAVGLAARNPAAAGDGGRERRPWPRPATVAALRPADAGTGVGAGTAPVPRAPPRHRRKPPGAVGGVSPAGIPLERRKSRPTGHAIASRTTRIPTRAATPPPTPGHSPEPIASGSRLTSLLRPLLQKRGALG